MVDCIVCKKPDAQIKIEGDAIVTVCGDPGCRGKDGQTLGEWLLDNYHYVRDLEEFTVLIEGKTYTFPNDKRIIRGLQNRIQELKKEIVHDKADNPN